MSKLIAYIDQNNNSWEISKESIQYKGISTNQSSSAMYSGGENRNITISPEQYSELQELAQAALNDKSAHIDNRKMGSALLIFEGRGLILDMNASKKKSLDDFLRKL
jgi:uncharacterized protein YbaP (TraB family)